VGSLGVDWAKDWLRAANPQRLGQEGPGRQWPVCRDHHLACAAQRIKELERELKEGRRANDFLKVVCVYSPQAELESVGSSREGLDRLRPW
jgi:transposase-like protein